MRFLVRHLLLLWLLAGLGLVGQARAEPEQAMLTQSLPGKTMEQAIQDVKNAIASHNYTFVREQAIDSRLVPQGWEAGSAYIVCSLETALRKASRTCGARLPLVSPSPKSKTGAPSRRTRCIRASMVSSKHVTTFGAPGGSRAATRTVPTTLRRASACATR